MRITYLLLAVTVGSLFAVVNFAVAQDWIQTSAPSDTYLAVASSADGAKLVAVSGGDYYAGPIGSLYRGAIYTSTNSGGTWVVRKGPGLYWWTSVASSADGTKLAAVCEFSSFASLGSIYTSVDSGVTWTQTTAPNRYWNTLAMSANGLKLVAADSESIFISTDSGANWVETSAPTNQWSSVACSADGSKLVATDAGYPGDGFGGTGLIYRSIDSGTTWAATAAPALGWGSVASSSDGTKLVALTSGGLFGEVYISADSGATWTLTLASGNAVACSADGTRMVALGANGVFISADSGSNWAKHTQYLGYGNGFAASVAASADGRKWTAAVPDPVLYPYSAPGGDIYIWQTTPLPTLSITPSGSGALLSWNVPSLDFTLQQNSDLAATNWTDVPATPGLNLTNLQNQVMVSPTNGNTFYRLKH